MNKQLADQYGNLLDKRRPHESRTAESAIEACSVINAELRRVRKVMLSANPDGVELIALAVHFALKIHNESYNPRTSKYQVSQSEAAEEACKIANVDRKLAFLINLATDWSNDLETWADDILSNGAITAYYNRVADSYENANADEQATEAESQADRTPRSQDPQVESTKG